MSGKEIPYEDSLDMMNWGGLRAECMRLHDQLMVKSKKLLTQPVMDTRSKEERLADIDQMIQKKRREFVEILERDMSHPTTAELNATREIQSLIAQKVDVLAEDK